MAGLQLLPFLSYQGKTTKGGSNKAKVFFKTITLDGPLWKTNFFQKEVAHVSILL